MQGRWIAISVPKPRVMPADRSAIRLRLTLFAEDPVHLQRTIER